MKQGSEFYTLESTESPLGGDLTRLVAALLTLGAILDEEQPYQEFRELINDEPVRKVLWILQSRTRDGVEVKTLVAQWNNESWLAANPETPLAILRKGFANHRLLLGQIKEAAYLRIVRSGKRMVMIPSNASPEREAELLAKLNK